MRFFANPSTPKVRDAMSRGLIGCITTPKQGNAIPVGARYCADNGCFGKGYPGDKKWWAWVEALPNKDMCDFAVAPDVVGDALATLTRSAPWLAAIRSLGIPAAFVAQNGASRTNVPWDSLDVLFLGGSLECLPCGYVRPAGDRKTSHCPECNRCLSEWKLNLAARSLVIQAKARGKGVHMGRVNSLKRLRYADAIGCDSADGTYIAFGPDLNLPHVLGWLRDVNDQGVLA